MALPNGQSGSVNGVTQYKRAGYYKTAAETIANRQWIGFDDETDTFGYYNYPGSPEANVAANIGSYCSDTSNGVIYVKTTDTVNTGWLAYLNTNSILGRSGSTSVISGSTVTIKSPNYADASASATSVLNTGEYVTGLFTRTLPASAGLADGDLIEYVCTSASVLTIQAVGAQKIRLGNQISSAAGSCASTAIGDSISLRFRASDGFWYATSAVGNWTLT